MYLHNEGMTYYIVLYNLPVYWNIDNETLIIKTSKQNTSVSKLWIVR